MLATFFPIFDVPVFWPILLLYFFVLFFITMKRQVKHMIKHKYIPFDLGKKVRIYMLPVSTVDSRKGIEDIITKEVMTWSLSNLF